MSSANVEALRPMFVALKQQIADIDEQLDAASGGKSAGRRAFINQLMKDDENSKAITDLSEQVSDHALGNEEIPEMVRVALYFGLMKTLKDKFDEEFTKIVDAQVDTKPVETVTLSDEQLKALTQARSDLYKQAKYARELITMMNGDASEFEMPKSRRGGRGKRGVREISKFTWTVDGERVNPDKDNLTEIAKDFGFTPANGGPVKLRDLMRDAKINLTKPTSPIEFTLEADLSPDGKQHVLLGVKRADADEDEEDDEEENGEDEEDEEDE